MPSEWARYRGVPGQGDLPKRRSRDSYVPAKVADRLSRTGEQGELIDLSEPAPPELLTPADAQRIRKRLQRGPCGDCDGTIMWIVTEKTRTMMPLDLDPTDNGNVAIVRPRSDLRLFARVYGNGKMPAGVIRYTAHQATCPGKKGAALPHQSEQRRYNRRRR